VRCFLEYHPHRFGSPATLALAKGPETLRPPFTVEFALVGGLEIGLASLKLIPMTNSTLLSSNQNNFK
jgi:hypothetical protein